ncbi:hypothetical protein ACAN91_000763 [Listeria monocytogenes]|uniref:hypothetical protein n=1 Tax=Listeria monocytogenes TaxID=1639 RepID=UPI0011EA8994|nr:hypothetical protein [Listeria monocytogenes]EAE7735046.1 hypothetical protein [Listeria monocytogenes]ELC1491670.1 hypothetical protein [Listeria monocytogenes]TYU36236.1 hypothetical protein FZW74_06520 [Listeria monocytogenes]TYU45581.1 hypothetical protein FZW78_02025 [Listeria monocytogenes]TYU49193.1 hypothetical protein FZW86_04570 [Listeria monocytogenes]
MDFYKEVEKIFKGYEQNYQLKLTKIEREGILPSTTIYEKIINELIICERGFNNHFQELLRGETLSGYGNKEFVSNLEKSIIERELLTR